MRLIPRSFWKPIRTRARTSSRSSKLGCWEVRLNSSGIGLCANALVCGWDTGEPGVPFHMLLRAILDSETVSDAVSALARGWRASSANYVIADEDGLAIDIEAAPGDYTRLYVGHPEHRLILHANHFGSPRFDGHDVALYAMPDSPFRLQRIRQLTDDLALS